MQIFLYILERNVNINTSIEVSSPNMLKCAVCLQGHLCDREHESLDNMGINVDFGQHFVLSNNLYNKSKSCPKEHNIG